MSFLEFMISSTEYNGWTSLFGAARYMLWAITWILTAISNVVEQIYNHIFSLFGVIYSEKVVGFLQGWIGYLWIPVAISIIILGYNLIMGDDTEGNSRVKTFARNLCLFAIILFGLPYPFLGNTSQSGVFTNSSATGYQGNGTITSNSGLIDVFTNDNGQGFVNGVSNMSRGSTESTEGSHTYGIVANNTYDLKLIFLQVENRNPNETKSRNQQTQQPDWSQRYLEAGKIKKNIYQKMGSDGKVKNKAGDSIMSLSINDFTDYVDVDKIGDDKYKISDVMVDGYDYGIFFTDDNSKDDIHEYFIDDEPNASELTSNQYYKPQDVSLRQYLFKSYHLEVIRNYDDNGSKKSVWYSSGGKTQSGLVGGLGSTFPFRYKIEWGIMFVQLISTAIVMLLTTYKIARIIYEIVFNHFLALFFGAADLSNGQRIKEILKSIVSLLLSLLFAVVLVEFYFIITDSVNNIQFIPNDEGANKWMQVLVDFFIAVATVKGPSVLEKILGVEGGLSGAWRDMGAATRPARNAARAVGRGAMKLAKGAAIAGVATGYYAHKHHQGALEARKEQENGNQRKIKGGKDRSRAEVPGKSSQFSAINNGKTEKGLTEGERKSTAKKGATAATEEMARQSRDLGKEVDKAKTDEARNDIANRYRSNIQHAALAEQADAGGKEKMGDKEALTRAYENSGFSKEEASSLAARDVASGSFNETNDKFENSISAQAQQRLSDNPTEYSNELEAYKASAMDHYQSLGFDESTAANLAETKAKQVLLDDKQAEIRDKAMEIRRTGTDDIDTSVVQGPTAPSDIKDDKYYLEKASKQVLGDSSVGYKGNAREAASHIYSQGTLKEGPVIGRIANNAVRERAEVNTRSGSLQNDMNPAAKAAATIVGGYFVERAAETLHGAGTKAGYSGYQARNAKRTEKDYQKLKKQRNKR